MCVQAEAGAVTEPEFPNKKHRQSLEIHTRFGNVKTNQHRTSAEPPWQANPTGGEGRNGSNGMDSRLCTEDDESAIYRGSSNLTGYPGL